MKNKNLFLVMLILIIGVTACAVSQNSVKSKEFKNLKVLPQNISHEELDKIMDGFKVSLGVKCNFCHASGKDGKLDFPSDDKPEKLIARKMITMTNDINKKYFSFAGTGEVVNKITCYTCHNGKEIPASKP